MIDIPTVKRHSVDGYGRQDICYNDPNGEFVYYDDYLALWQELNSLRKELRRKVELPEFKVHSNQPCWPSIAVGLRDEEWIETLKKQGYEVKP